MREAGAVVRIGKKTHKLTKALTASEIEVGAIGPAQRHLMSQYQQANELERNLLRRIWAVAMMRANCIQWDVIEQELAEPDPAKFQGLEIWRQVYEAAEEANLGETASHAIATCRKLLRSKSDWVRAQAAGHLLNARAKQWKQRKEETGTLAIQQTNLTPEAEKLFAQIKQIPPDLLRALLAEPVPIESQTSEPSRQNIPVTPAIAS